MIKVFSTSLYLLKPRTSSLRLQHLRSLSCSKRLFQEEPNLDHVKTNAANVQLLSPDLHNQIFLPYATTTTDASHLQNLRQRERLSQEHLTIQDIWGNKSDSVEPIHLQLPGMYGDNIEEHFMRIGLEQTSTILEKADRFAKIDLPTLPTSWLRQAGWTRYDTINGKTQQVDHPLEDALVFDVEVLVSEGHYPMMAVAASSKAWYAWTSPYLISGKESDKQVLISMGGQRSSSASSSHERLMVGHNVGYDRARIAEEYNQHGSGMHYVDTMSLHIAVAGLCSQQRPAWNSARKKQQEKLLAAATAATTANSIDTSHLGAAASIHNSFFDVSAHNNLKDVAKFHCNLEMDKTQRSYFVDGTLSDIQHHFDSLLSYCAQDVLMTHKVYQTVLPKFRDNCPHPVSFAGMVQMGSSFLTVTDKWEQYLKRSVQKHKELDDMLDIKLQGLADHARGLVETPEIWQADPWLSQLDWLVNPRQRKLKGAPKWYKDAYDTKSGKLKITTRSRIAPLLLRLKWQGYPLHYFPQFGWCYKVDKRLPPPQQQVDGEDGESGAHDGNNNNNKKKPVREDDDYRYYKVPHKDGEDANCGNPLAKNYMDAYEDNTLSSEYEAAKEALELNAMSAYWISSRERILGQFVVWDDNQSVDLGFTPAAAAENSNNKTKYGMILPQMVAMGTVTRRAVERTWLTASNAKANRIGSELKSMVQAPDGYKIVGADVDSEELWISSVIGDAQFGFHGATALGWMTLQGTKSQGTDLHSKTAAILGISRNKAKIFNYARIYGAGVKYATSLLMQYSQGMDLETAKARALDLYSSTKGEKEHRKRNPFKRIFWHGGSESYMFNALEAIALSEDPRTPVLGCAVTDALKPKYTKDKFLTSRINWVVQSSGVDYLHLLLVSMAHLIERYDIDARFMLSVHDEVRYLASEKDQHRTALALQVANLWTRAMFSYKLGIHNLPQSIAFFSAVDLDHVLRKEPTMTCTTPSHEEAIEVGQTSDILDTIKTLDRGQDGCLLGEEKATAGKTLAPSVVKQALDQMQTMQGVREIGDIKFLKAQMYKDYRQHSFDDEDNNDPARRGGKETEEKVNSIDPMQQDEEQQQDFEISSTPAPKSRSVPASSRRSKRKDNGSSSSSARNSSSTTSVILRASPDMMFSSSGILEHVSSSRKFRYKNQNQRPSSSSSMIKLKNGPDAYFDGKNVYFDN